MKKIKLDTKSVYMGVSTADTVIALWEKNFLHESAKFISATHLQPEDLGAEFLDEEGEKWKILGQMDGRDMPCKKLSTDEVFVWDKWRVSKLLHPEVHEKMTKNSVTFAPKKTTKRTKKVEVPVVKEVPKQLDLFGTGGA